MDRFIEKALERLRHMTWTCALDVAERFRAGEISLGGVGQILGCGEDAATKAEERAVEKVIMAFGDRDKAMAGLRALIEEST